MLDLNAWLYSLLVVLAISVLTWLVSLVRKDVSIVDSLWSLMILACLLAYLVFADTLGPRVTLMTALVAIWAIRLSAYITVRNHGEGEDRRYQAIRANNQPNFEFKSLYIVFLFQGLLAWVICLPVVAAVSGEAPPGPLDYLGVALWLIGMVFEVVGDFQLSRFLKDKRSETAVLDTGLWRYTRHPNYFGEAVLWWGFYLLALSAGAWWTIIAPLLMTFLLLRVSGVAMLEKDIAGRRPAYRDYIRKTNAFFPGKPRKLKSTGVATLVLLSMLALQPVGAQESLTRELPVGSAWRFKVYLDDQEIGYQNYFVAELAGMKQMRSVADFDYKMLFISLFQYQHETSEIWTGDCLQSIHSRTDANGEPFRVDGRQEPGQFRVAGVQGEATLPECVMSFAFWNPKVLEQSRLLNAQDGTLLDVDISSPVFEELEVRGESRPSYRYRLAAGALNLDLWYSTDNEWLALESEVRGGRTLRYERM